MVKTEECVYLVDVQRIFSWWDTSRLEIVGTGYLSYFNSANGHDIFAVQ